MNKEEFVAAIAENTKFTKVDTKKFLDAYIDVVTTALKFGNIVQLINENGARNKPVIHHDVANTTRRLQRQLVRRICQPPRAIQHGQIHHNALVGGRFRADSQS